MPTTLNPKFKYESEYYVTPNDKIDLKNIRNDINEKMKESTEDLFRILYANFFETRTDTMKYVKNSKNTPASINITLTSRISDSNKITHFKIRVVYSEDFGAGICVDSIENETRVIFKFDIVERNFIDMLMKYYNDESGKDLFVLPKNKYNYEKYIIGRYEKRKKSKNK